MGDRSHVFVADDRSRDDALLGVYLYSHFGGDDLPIVVQTALARRQRWADPPYLARILFCAMVRGVEDDEAGFGISATLGDNEHLIIVVDCNSRRVTFCRPVPFESYGVLEGAVCSWTFDEFVNLPGEVIANAWATEDDDLE